MLFKGLQKCVLFMISKPSYFDAKLTRTFVMLALGTYACSLVKNEFIKVGVIMSLGILACFYRVMVYLIRFCGCYLFWF